MEEVERVDERGALHCDEEPDELEDRGVLLARSGAVRDVDGGIRLRTAQTARRHAGHVQHHTMSAAICVFWGGGVGDEAGAQGVKMRRRRQRREGMQSEVSAGSDARTYPEERAVRSGPCDDHNESPRATRTDPDAEDRCHEE